MNCPIYLFVTGPELLKGNMLERYLNVFDSFSAGHSVSSDDGCRVNLLLDKLISIAKEFSGDDYNWGGAVTNLLVLKLGKLDKNLTNVATK